MLLRISLISSLAMALALSSCATTQTKPPRLVTCILDPPAGALDCYDPIEDRKYAIDLSFAQNYVCFPADQAKELVLYMRLQTP